MTDISSIIEEGLKKHALTSFSLSDETKAFINQNFQQEIIKKNAVLTSVGEKEKFLYFLETGILRYWTEDIHLQEITFWFSLSGEFANSYYSFCKNAGSDYTIQALTDCRVWRIKKELFFNACESSLEICNLSRVVMEEIFTRKIRREIELLKYTIEERYKRCIIYEKNLFRNIPLKYIASYLGATPQSISRIRKKIFT